MVLPWIHQLQAKCANLKGCDLDVCQSNTGEITKFNIPEELFHGMKNRVYRKFMKSRPWINKENPNYCTK